ncbi:hypothetical protein AM493_12900 [Flavobacterium akiainvivens]|uniref:Uncharacterized protein n=1 Tax=Flavobacterium akiainvivens TaxID=1202724 RepID=A0A0N0RQU2_9FLAO|nr:hypothetical protein [Flavobacterium akiainvivens]KOS06822.1 hypothetical protein AM493_12900 [Flavobacterium akiainvivens]SFQ75194.1 hypothetical protein SAMN05444144_12128 [Flavobacterium akiainvivens]
MKKILTPAFILFWISALITLFFFEKAFSPSTSNFEAIAVSVYLGLANAVVVYFFIKQLMKELEQGKKE